MNKLMTFANEHFEAFFLLYMWIAACCIAFIVGKPWLGIIGIFTVLPVLAAYAWRVRITRSD